MKTTMFIMLGHARSCHVRDAERALTQEQLKFPEAAYIFTSLICLVILLLVASPVPTVKVM